MTFRFRMNWKGERSWGEPSRLMTRPTQPVPAQLTAMRSGTALGGLVDRPLAVAGIGHVTAHEGGPRSDLGDHLLSSFLVLVEDRDRGAAGGQATGGRLAQSRRAPGDDGRTSVDVHGRQVTGVEGGRQPHPEGLGCRGRAGRRQRGWAAAAVVASRSTRSFMGSPEWPFTQSEGDRTLVVQGQGEQRLPQVAIGHRLASASCAIPGAAIPPTTAGGSS